MKKIIIYQENDKEIELIDDNSDNISIYTKEVSKVLNDISSVYILETTSKNLIVKPSKINLISVEELDIENSLIKNEIVNNESDIIKD